jgi:hypothetical protein
MTNYRFQFVVDGRVQSVQSFAAANDRAAKQYLDERRRGRAGELWSLTRLVRTYPAEP